MRLITVFAAAAVLVAVSAMAVAQGPGAGGARQGGRQRMAGAMGQRGMGGLQLLNVPAIQQELKMTPEQIGQLPAKQQQLQTARRELMGNQQPGQGAQMTPEQRAQRTEQMQAIQDKAVAEVLLPEQVKRFKQIELQWGGINAMQRGAVATELKLTREQRQQIRQIQQDANQANMGLFQGMGNLRDLPQQEREAKMAEVRAKMLEARTATNAKAVAVLTAEQQAQWKAMVGAPFTFPKDMPLGAGPGGAGRRGQRGAGSI